MNIKKMQRELLDYIYSTNDSQPMDSKEISSAISKMAAECSPELRDVLAAYYVMSRKLLEPVTAPNEHEMWEELSAYVKKRDGVTKECDIARRIFDLAEACPAPIVNDKCLISDTEKAYEAMQIEKGTPTTSPCKDIQRDATTTCQSDEYMLLDEIKACIARHGGNDAAQRAMLQSWVGDCRIPDVREYGLHLDVLKAYFMMHQIHGVELPKWLQLRHYEEYRIPESQDELKGRVHAYVMSSRIDWGDKDYGEKIADLASACPTSLRGERDLDTSLKRAYMQIMVSENGEPAEFRVGAEPLGPAPDDKHTLYDNLVKYVSSRLSTTNPVIVQEYIDALSKAWPDEVFNEHGLTTREERAYYAAHTGVWPGRYLDARRYVDNDFMFTAEENSKLEIVKQDATEFMKSITTYVRMREGSTGNDAYRKFIADKARQCPEATTLRKSLKDDISKAYAVVLVEQRKSKESARKAMMDITVNMQQQSIKKEQADTHSFDPINDYLRGYMNT